MAPKKDQDTIAAEKIKTLCILIASDTEFNPDFDVVAQEVQLAQAKNVTRKINSIIEPVGYTMKGRKVVKVDDDTTTATATITSTAATSSTAPTTTATSDDDIDDISASTKTKTRAKKVANKTKTPAKPSAKSPAKKRKVEESESDNEMSDSPATKAIKEATAGSDVEPGGDSSE